MRKLLVPFVLLALPALSGCIGYPVYGPRYRRVYHDDYDHVTIHASPESHHPLPGPPHHLPSPPRPWRP